MTRLAFTSCVCSGLFPDQPVWSWIDAHRPDHLLLLGDNVYIDIPIFGGVHPDQFSDTDFATHLLRLYRQLLAQPGFGALVRRLGPGRVWSIWDDHDFLWNDAAGDDAFENPRHRQKVLISGAVQHAWRQSLAQALGPGSFPADITDARVWSFAPQHFEPPSVQLADGVQLHLSDNRRWRTRRLFGGATAFGSAQRALFGDRMRAAAPQALHLFASGQQVATYRSHYRDDFDWLLDTAAAQRMLVLSGDVHRNDMQMFAATGGGHALYDATASGAAIGGAAVVQRTQPRRNFGLVDIDDTQVTVRCFAQGHAQPNLTLVLRRDTWQRAV